MVIPPKNWSKRRADPRCAQRFIQEDDLEAQIEQALRHVAIDDDYRDWTLEQLRVVHDQELRTHRTIDSSLDAIYRSPQKEGNLGLLESGLGLSYVKLNSRGDWKSEVLRIFAGAKMDWRDQKPVGLVGASFVVGGNKKGKDGSE